MIQLEALLKGEVSTGEDLAQGKLQHPQSTLQVVIQHLGSGPARVRGELGPQCYHCLLVLASLGLLNKYATISILWDRDRPDLSLPRI